MICLKRLLLALTCILLYLNFRLTLSGSMGMGRWDGPAACRPQDRGADELVILWHWLLAKCVGSQSRLGLCPKLEPLMERPTKASSYLQEGARTL
jgi:hypothetical protein